MREKSKYSFQPREALTLTRLEKIQQGRNSYEMLPNTESFFKDLVGQIENASSSVDMQFYAFEGDAAGYPIAQALIRASRRGVKVRLMVDNYINLAHNDHLIQAPRLNRQLQREIVGEWKDTNQMLTTLMENGVDVQMINPLGAFKHKVLQRDHKKLVVIDSVIPNKAVAYMGGINPTDHNASWNDFMIKMRGDMMPLLQADFDRTWQQDNKGEITRYSEGLVVTDSVGHSNIIPVAIQLIDQAKEKVIIESPNLWGRNIGQALQRSANRGVETSLIVPQPNIKRLFPSELWLRRMRRARIHVFRFQYNGGRTHARALLTDSIGTFGSNTFNEFLGGRIGEINIVTNNSSLVSQLDRKLTSDMRSSLQHR